MHALFVHVKLMTDSIDFTGFLSTVFMLAYHGDVIYIAPWPIVGGDL